MQGDLFDHQLQFLRPDPQLSPCRCSDQLDLCGSLGSPHHLHSSPRRQRGPTWLWLRALEVKKSKINIPFSFIYGFIVIEVVRIFSIFYLTFIGLQIFQLMHSQKLYFYNWENWVTPLSYGVVSANTASWKPQCYKKSVTGCTERVPRYTKWPITLIAFRICVTWSRQKFTVWPGKLLLCKQKTHQNLGYLILKCPARPTPENLGVWVIWVWQFKLAMWEAKEWFW